MGPDEAGTARDEPSFRLTPHFELNRFVIEVFHDKNFSNIYAAGGLRWLLICLLELKLICLSTTMLENTISAG